VAAAQGRQRRRQRQGAHALQRKQGHG
jgi:hypothetical protein